MPGLVCGKRVAKVAALLAVVLMGAGTPGAAPAIAAEPQPQIGWWWAGSPLPAPVTVPPGGLWIAASGGSPVAVAAVRVELGTPLPASATLVLPLHMAVGTPAMSVCKATTAWTPAAGGELSDAPATSCPAGAVSAVASIDGQSLQVPLSGLAAVDGSIDLALVAPDGTSESVVFSAPTVLVGDRQTPHSPAVTSSPSVSPSSQFDTGSTTEPPLDVLPGPALGPVTTEPVTVAPRPVVSSTPEPQLADGERLPAALVSTPGDASTVAVACLALVILGAWTGVARTALVGRT